MNNKQGISIIIPVFNEADNILQLIDYLEKVSAGFVDEIIVVDGGSTDGITEILQHDKRVKLVQSEKGRAKQMNFGAALSNSKILYFLHADSFPPPNFDRDILLFYRQKRLAGCFRLKFDSKHWWLKFAGWLSSINHICCRGGDQSLYVENDLFQETGGFNEEYIIYKDNEFIKNLYEEPRTRFKVIKRSILTSARLYDKVGVWELQKIYFQIYLKRFLGAGPDQLYQQYKKLLL